ncbi:MAG: MBL fold metallo-hydrolase [Bacillota bacterium]|jgi:glyoxylase-like metal-dependent hydrolase (beta-lactamase superfamily II)|nr:MBL fold metallo-hydrolase [Eubacteriales bacterium]MDI9492409.1 MBL fold metallo-hydrolase [Bacillota bacterium]NLV70279.1 MBL fold metallo-hydrolase [Clostridiales bacterium]HRV33509.1 MBL fold metallo-hydrolase [Anaerovoracaceae bacterium]MDD3537817.1 MBL fold metallo-hydrolase [Eubacteriales bacterium]
MKVKVFPCGYLQTNCYLVWNESTKNAFIVDPGDVSPDLKAWIQKEKLTPQYVLLTHGHGDHTGGLADIKKEFPEIRSVASKKERKFLLERKTSYGAGGIECDIYVEDGQEMQAADTTLRFLSTPGHTPGGMCILMDKTLFSGDTLFRCSVGRSDFPGGDQEALIRSIREKLLVLPADTRVLPGHEEETTIGYEERYNPFV